MARNSASGSLVFRPCVGMRYQLSEAYALFAARGAVHAAVLRAIDCDTSAEKQWRWCLRKAGFEEHDMCALLWALLKGEVTIADPANTVRVRVRVRLWGTTKRTTEQDMCLIVVVVVRTSELDWVDALTPVRKARFISSCRKCNFGPEIVEEKESIHVYQIPISGKRSFASTNVGVLWCVGVCQGSLTFATPLHNPHTPPRLNRASRPLRCCPMM